MSYDKYAYGVARVRSNELTLLSASDLEQLISAPVIKIPSGFGRQRLATARRG